MEWLIFPECTGFAFNLKLCEWVNILSFKKFCGNHTWIKIMIDTYVVMCLVKIQEAAFTTVN